MSTLTPEQIKKITKSTIAKKHNCTGQYVGQVLSGIREDNSEKAKAILETAKKMLEIIEAA